MLNSADNNSFSDLVSVYLRAIPEKGGEDRRRYIFLWVVSGESFQIIRVIVVRPNLITWVVGISLLRRGSKNTICKKKREVFYLI